MTEVKRKCKILKDLFPKYENTRNYIEHKNTILDITMSCDDMECIEQLKHICREADNRCDIYVLLAAYDIYEEVAFNIKNKL